MTLNNAISAITYAAAAYAGYNMADAATTNYTVRSVEKEAWGRRAFIRALGTCSGILANRVSFVWSLLHGIIFNWYCHKISDSLSQTTGEAWIKRHITKVYGISLVTALGMGLSAAKIHQFATFTTQHALYQSEIVQVMKTLLQIIVLSKQKSLCISERLLFIAFSLLGFFYKTKINFSPLINACLVLIFAKKIIKFVTNAYVEHYRPSSSLRATLVQTVHVRVRAS